MNTREETPKCWTWSSMVKYIRQHMSPVDLYSHICEDRLLTTGNPCWPPSTVWDQDVAEDSFLSVGLLAECLRKLGPGLVSFFEIRPEFDQVDTRSHAGTATGDHRGHHAVLLIGHRKHNGGSRFLIQNWWRKAVRRSRPSQSDVFWLLNLFREETANPHVWPPNQHGDNGRMQCGFSEESLPEA